MPTTLDKVRQDIQRERNAIHIGSRRRAILRILAKHGVLALFKDGIRNDEESLRKLGQRLRLAFEELGPTFIKLGQVLVTRQEMLPDEITDELAQLLDQVPPLPFEYMQTVLEDYLPEGIATFRWILEEPIGSASLAQVYRAQLRDGTDVAVKVVRPNVDKMFQTDIAVTLKLVKMLQKRLPVEIQATTNLVSTIRDYYSSSLAELDMVQEAQNMETARQLLKEGQFERIHIPKTYLVTPKVLITEYIDGWSLKEFPVDFLTFEERLLLMADLAHFYIYAFIQGAYHADAHASNILIDRHTKRAVVIDWGMSGRMDAVYAETIIRFLMHVRVNQIEDAVECMLDLYQPSMYTNIPKMKDEFRSAMIRYVDSVQGDAKLNWGAMLIENVKIAAKHKCIVPSGLALFAKGWSATEGTARWLCPEVSYHALVETADIIVARAWLNRRFNYRATASIFSDVIKFGTTLPRRINKILEQWAWNTSRVAVATTLEPATTRLLNRSVNRLTIALLSGGLYLGSAVIQSFGSRVPGLAGAGKVGMVVSIIGMAYLSWRILRSRRA